MPKSSVRCIDKHLRMMGHGCHYPTTTSHVQSGSMSGCFLLSAPRKISFEDNRSGSDSNHSTCSDDTRIPIKNTKTETTNEHCPAEKRRRGGGTKPPTMIRRKLSLLVRPTTSLSLVDLAKSVPQEANVDGDDSYRDEEEEQHIEERKAKRIPSFKFFPRSIVSTESNLLSSSDADNNHQPSGNSNWGHFVNMVVDEEDYEEEEYHRNFLIIPSSSSYDANANAILEHYRKPSFRSSCTELPCHRVRRRRSSPYAEYKNYRRAREAMKPALSFIHRGLHHHTDDSSNLDTTYSIHGYKFHSSPTRRTGKNNGEIQEQTTEQLIGAFSELQVRKQQQKACVQQQQNRC